MSELNKDLVSSAEQSTVEIIMEKLNLPEIIAGPAGKAIARLVAGAVEIPAAYLDSFAQSLKDKTQARTLVNQEVARAAAKFASSDANIVERAAHNLISKEYRRQKNKEEIARKTVELLREDADLDPNAHAQQPLGNVDDDWLNIFEKYAEDASTERMQNLWSRILAGQIRNPKRFSLKTLRFISELDQHTAKSFEKYASMICNGAFIPTPEILDSETINDLLHLQDSGILTNVGGDFHKMFYFTAEKIIIISNQKRRITIKSDTLKSINIKSVFLTKVGVEIASMISIPFDMNSISKIVTYIPKEQIENITLSGQQEGQLWPDPRNEHK